MNIQINGKSFDPTAVKQVSEENSKVPRSRSKQRSLSTVIKVRKVIKDSNIQTEEEVHDDELGQSTILTKESYPDLLPNYQNKMQLQVARSSNAFKTPNDTFRSRTYNVESYRSTGNYYASQERPMITLEVKKSMNNSQKQLNSKDSSKFDAVLNPRTSQKKI